mmetsp:Transcript_18113/g.43494  ORF Transcript_18113/g.43494 Transcript_18113/m.43494 type:complete len:302 (-) Transcript_18113:63-968(-)
MPGMHKGSKWGLALCVAGAFFQLGSVMVDSWREGTGNTEFPGSNWGQSFDTKGYGLLYTSGGSYRLTWSQVARNTCERASSIYRMGAASTILSAIGSGNDCDDTNTMSEQCDKGFVFHMWERCRAYTAMSSANTGLLAASLMGIITMMIIGILCLIANIQKLASIIAVILMILNVMSIAVLVIYAVITDIWFHRLGESATYPYPPLSWGFYVYAFGALLLTVGDIMFGYVNYALLPFDWAAWYKKKEDKKKRRKGVQSKKQAMAAQAAPMAQGYPAQQGYAPQQAQYSGYQDPYAQQASGW